MTCFYQQNTRKVRKYEWLHDSYIRVQHLLCWSFCLASWLWESKQMSWRSPCGREFWAASSAEGSPGAKWTTRKWTKRQTLPQASFQMIPQPWSTALDGSIAEKPGKQHADSRNSKITDVFFQAAKNLLHYFNMLVDKWYRPLEWHKHLYLNKLFHRSVKSELGSHRSMVGN